MMGRHLMSTSIWLHKHIWFIHPLVGRMVIRGTPLHMTVVINPLIVHTKMGGADWEALLRDAILPEDVATERVSGIGLLFLVDKLKTIMVFKFV